MRRLRAILALALLWAVAWAPVGLVMGLEHGMRWDHVGMPRPPGLLVSTLIRFAWQWALVGAITGACFAGILAIAEKRHGFASLSWSRFVLWGALGAAVLPALAFVFVLIAFQDTPSVRVVPMLSFLALGAASAAGTLALARRGKSAGMWQPN